MKAILPPNEPARIEALRRYEILDTLPEAGFDDLAKLAAHICATPLAQVNLIAAERQFSKASVGQPAADVPREHSFCSHTILEGGVMQVEDARRDPRFADNPLVTTPAGIVFYAGAPVRTPEGLALGALCVVDRVPRSLGPEQRDALAALARQVETQLELRLRLRAQAREIVAGRRSEADLVRSHEELERRIEERTAELDRERRLVMAVLDSIDSGIIACDAAGRMTVFNREMVRLHGRRPEDVPPERWSQHYGLLRADGTTPLRPEEVPLYRALQGERFADVEVVVRPEGGPPRLLVASGQPMLGREEARLGAVVAVRDVTERRQAEEIRRNEQKFLQAVLDNVEAGIVACDAQGRITLFNRALLEFHGLKRAPASIEEWTRQLADQLEIGGVPVPLEETPIYRATRGETFRGVELVFRSKDGSLRVVLASGQPILDPQGRRMGAVVVRHDITGIKKAEEELRRQREALHQSEKLAAMGQLLAGVAHELNNPLAVVIGHAGLLRRSLSQGAEAERVDKMRTAAERCARIVRNFLALARQQPPERSRVRVNETIQDTLELISYPLRADGIEVGLSLAPELPPLWADRHQLQQVLINLLTNAHHALREVPAPRRLSVITRHDAVAGRIVIDVADSGPGMTPEVSRRIFDPFFTTKPEGHGTGLGLSLCRGIVESHGGALSVESEPGRGATFRVALPVGAPERESEARAPAADGAERSLSVLVVDDERGVRELIAELLQRDGHKVQAAADGAAALERLAAGAFDLVLSDIRMPRLDGLGLYREAARRHPGMERRFVFVTGDTLTPDTREFLQRSRAPQLAKPFDAEQLRSVLGQALARAAGSDAEDEEPGGSGKEGR